jgi:hypothetical protein
LVSIFQCDAVERFGPKYLAAGYLGWPLGRSRSTGAFSQIRIPEARGAEHLFGDEAAEMVIYRADLKTYPENGWSLMGLREALVAQGRTGGAASLDKRFQKQWATADIKPPSTCYCQVLTLENSIRQPEFGQEVRAKLHR